jgi:hypothetical protein
MIKIKNIWCDPFIFLYLADILLIKENINQ